MDVIAKSTLQQSIITFCIGNGYLLINHADVRLQNVGGNEYAS